MIKKTPVKGSDDKVSVTFETSLPNGGATAVSVVGDFNGWDPAATPMKKRKDGSWAATVRLATKRSWQYRFVIDGERWTEDPDNSETVPNPYGGSNAVCHT